MATAVAGGALRPSTPTSRGRPLPASPSPDPKKFATLLRSPAKGPARPVPDIVTHDADERSPRAAWAASSSLGVGDASPARPPRSPVRHRSPSPVERQAKLEYVKTVLRTVNHENEHLVAKVRRLEHESDERVRLLEERLREAEAASANALTEAAALRERLATSALQAPVQSLAERGTAGGSAEARSESSSRSVDLKRDAATSAHDNSRSDSEKSDRSGKGEKEAAAAPLGDAAMQHTGDGRVADQPTHSRAQPSGGPSRPFDNAHVVYADEEGFDEYCDDDFYEEWDGGDHAQREQGHEPGPGVEYVLEGGSKARLRDLLVYYKVQIQRREEEMRELNAEAEAIRQRLGVFYHQPTQAGHWRSRNNLHVASRPVPDDPFFERLGELAGSGRVPGAQQQHIRNGAAAGAQAHSVAQTPSTAPAVQSSRATANRQRQRRDNIRAAVEMNFDARTSPSSAQRRKAASGARIPGHAPSHQAPDSHGGPVQQGDFNATRRFGPSAYPGSAHLQGHTHVGGHTHTHPHSHSPAVHSNGDAAEDGLAPLSATAKGRVSKAAYRQRHLTRDGDIEHGLCFMDTSAPFIPRGKGHVQQPQWRIVDRVKRSEEVDRLVRQIQFDFAVQGLALLMTKESDCCYNLNGVRRVYLTSVAGRLAVRSAGGGGCEDFVRFLKRNWSKYVCRRVGPPPVDPSLASQSASNVEGQSEGLVDASRVSRLAAGPKLALSPGEMGAASYGHVAASAAEVPLGGYGLSGGDWYYNSGD